MTNVSGFVQDGINRIAIIGDMEMFGSGKIKGELWELAWKQNYTVVEINLENVNYIDSSGVAVLISFITMLQKGGKKVKVVKVKERVLSVFHLACLDTLIFGAKH